MKFSIITVCYNAERIIERTIRSVANQTFTDYEYIIIDGKSTDGTLSKIKHNEGIFNGRLRVISEPDKGIYNAMNKGAELATGEYYLFLNADDAYTLDMLEAYNKEIERSKCDYYYSNNYNVYENKTVTRDTSIYQIIRGMPYCHQTMCVSSKAFNALAGYDESLRVISDWDFSLRLFLSGYSYRKVDGYFVYYKKGGISSIKNYDREFEYVYNKNLRDKLSLSYEDYEYFINNGDRYDETRLTAILDEMYRHADKDFLSVFMKWVYLYRTHEFIDAVERLKKTTSWKITEPLRKLSGILRH